MRKFVAILFAFCMFSGIFTMLFVTEGAPNSQLANNIIHIMIGATCFIAGATIWIHGSEIVNANKIHPAPPKETYKETLERRLKEALAKNTVEGYKEAAKIRDTLAHINQNIS